MSLSLTPSVWLVPLTLSVTHTEGSFFFTIHSLSDTSVSLSDFCVSFFTLRTPRLENSTWFIPPTRIVSSIARHKHSHKETGFIWIFIFNSHWIINCLFLFMYEWLFCFFFWNSVFVCVYVSIFCFLFFFFSHNLFLFMCPIASFGSTDVLISLIFAHVT